MTDIGGFILKILYRSLLSDRSETAMKSIIRIFAVMLLVLVLCLTACTGGGDTVCTEHTDADKDGRCDICDAAVEPEQGTDGSDELVLIEDGEARFQIVLGGDISANIRLSAKNLEKALGKLGITVAVVDERDSTVTECEVLIGRVTSRGEDFDIDGHKLGPDGKAIYRVGDRLILSGGSETALAEVVEEFSEDILGLNSDTESIDRATVGKDDLYEKLKTDYDWTSLTIGGESAEGFKIAVDKTVIPAVNAARYVQGLIYNSVGYWLPIEDTVNMSDMSGCIVISCIPNTWQGNGYATTISGTTLKIETEYPYLIETLTQEVFGKYRLMRGDVEIGSEVAATRDVRTVYYSEYVKDIDTSGKRNAYEGIKATHEFANKNGHTVAVKKGEKYLITETDGDPIVIKTDVNWTGAEFIIDDRNLKLGSDPERPLSGTSGGASVFRVGSDYTVTRMLCGKDDTGVFGRISAAGGVDKETVNASGGFFGLSFGYPAMIIPINDNQKMFIRYGANANSGEVQRELIVMDAEGNTDPMTPLLFDYAEVTYIDVCRIDDRPITLKGGIFTTRANASPCEYDYSYARNIAIERSNVTVSGVTHRITDEGDTGGCYSGFFYPRYCNNLTVEDCTVQAHRTYVASNGTGMGSYELSGLLSNDLLYRNTKQSNFYHPKTGEPTTNFFDENGEIPKNNVGQSAEVWGVHGSSYCKNITYESCVLNRLDAHAGVVNASIIDSDVVYIRIIGGGTMLIQNSKIYNNTMISLREDYGSTWDGDIKIIDTTHVMRSTAAQPTIISGQWYNHDFGYKTHMPHTVLIDNYSLEGTTVNTVHVFSTFAISYDITGSTLIGGTKNENPMALAERVIFRRMGDTDLTFTVSASEPITSAVTVVREDE